MTTGLPSSCWPDVLRSSRLVGSLRGRIPSCFRSWRPWSRSLALARTLTLAVAATLGRWRAPSCELRALARLVLTTVLDERRMRWWRCWLCASARCDGWECRSRTLLQERAADAGPTRSTTASTATPPAHLAQGRPVRSECELERDPWSRFWSRRRRAEGWAAERDSNEKEEDRQLALSQKSANHSGRRRRLFPRSPGVYPTSSTMLLSLFLARTSA